MSTRPVDVAGAGNCLNCGASLQGRYCASCGQKAASTRLALRNVLHEAVHEFLHLDGKIFRTIKVLVLSPGRLTTEFLEGRRASYISPLRVYLTFSLLFFILSALLPGGQAGFLNITYTDEESGGWTFRTGAAAPGNPAVREASPQAREQIAGSFMSNVSRAIFVLMPAAGLVTFAFFRRREPYFVSHLYYSIHLHAFAFLAFTVAVLFSRLGEGRVVTDLISALAVATLLPYHFVALRRVFRESWGRTIWKGVAVTLLYLVLLGVAVGVVIVVTISGLDLER